MSKKNNRKVLELAYSQVNNVSKSELENREHQEAIDKALTSVWSYEGLYDGENETLRERRLDLDSPKDGECTELAQHFKELYPEEFMGEPAWSIIFTMYNRMKILSNEETGEGSGSISSETVELAGNSDTNNTILKNEKEKETMAKFDSKASEMNGESLDELQAAISTKGLGSDIDAGAKPVATNKVTIDEARKSLEKDQAERLNTTKSTIVEKVVKSGPKATERAVAGEQASGTVSNPEATFAKFCEKFGADVSTGEVRFKNVAPGSQEDALAIYNALLKAKEDPEAVFPAYISKNEGTIKGVKVVDGKGEVSYLTLKDLITFIATKAMGVLNTPDPAVQLQLQKARKTSSKKSAGTGLAKKTPEGLKGIATVRFTDRKKAVSDMAVNHKELDKTDVAARAGFKSVMKAQYIRHKATEDGEDTVQTYRFPLNVEQYGLVVVDEAMKAIYGDGSRGIGNVVAPIDITESENLSKMLNEIIGVVAEAAASGVQGDFFDAIRTNADKAQSADVAAMAGEYEGV